MANDFTHRMRSIGYLPRGRTRAQVTEGREHPETGRPFKSVSDEAGTVTEHNTKDDRVDAVVRPVSITSIRTPRTGKVTNDGE
jgi:hypothetical protein